VRSSMGVTVTIGIEVMVGDARRNYDAMAA
jgi:hypothetical protein